jgi:hypothetical protein
MFNTKAQSTGFSFLIFLTIIFVCGLIYLLFGQVFSAYLLPAMGDLSANQLNITQQADYSNQTTIYMYFLKSIPFLIIGVAILFVVVNAMRKKSYEE